MEGLGERLKTIRGHLTQAAVAESCGISIKTLQNFEQGISAPNSDTLLKLAKFYRVSTDWILTGEEPVVSATTEDKPGYSYIPLYVQPACAGAGALVLDEQVGKFLAFRTEWIRQTLRSNVADLFLMPAIGDSMEPTIRHGDVLLVDKGHQKIIYGQIYVLTLGDELIVKETRVETPGTLTLYPHNKNYTPLLIDEHNRHGLHTIGRVMWIGRTLV